MNLWSVSTFSKSPSPFRMMLMLVLMMVLFVKLVLLTVMMVLVMMIAVMESLQDGVMYKPGARFYDEATDSTLVIFLHC